MFPDAEEFLDGLAIEVAGVHRAEHLQNSWKSVKPCGFGRHLSASDRAERQEAIRHYVLFRRLRWELMINDKGHYHSYYRGAHRFQDPPGTRSSASELPVEGIGERRLPALLALEPSSPTDVGAVQRPLPSPTPVLQRHLYHLVCHCPRSEGNPAQRAGVDIRCDILTLRVESVG